MPDDRLRQPATPYHRSELVKVLAQATKDVFVTMPPGDGVDRMQDALGTQLAQALDGYWEGDHPDILRASGDVLVRTAEIIEARGIYDSWKLVLCGTVEHNARQRRHHE